MLNNHILASLRVATAFSLGLLASTSFAFIQNATASSPADQPLADIWQAQQALTDSVYASGLIASPDVPKHEHNGIGGGDDDQVIVLDNDSINRTIDQINERDSNLNSMSNSPVNLRDLLAIEPVASAKVTSPFGYRSMGGRGEFHPGIDLAAPYGTPVYATGDGVVVYASWKNGYGNFIEIDHGNGYVTRYGHSSRLLVSVGQRIHKDQQISMVGCTGRCTGPHLHYEVLHDGKRQNPAMYLALAPRRVR